MKHIQLIEERHVALLLLSCSIDCMCNVGFM